MRLTQEQSRTATRAIASIYKHTIHRVSHPPTHRRALRNSTFHRTLHAAKDELCDVRLVAMVLACHNPLRKAWRESFCEPRKHTRHPFLGAQARTNELYERWGQFPRHSSPRNLIISTVPASRNHWLGTVRPSLAWNALPMRRVIV